MDYIFDGGFVGRSNGSAAGDHIMRMMIDMDRRLRANKVECTARLRRMGVKLAQAEDGWIDRERNTLTVPSYRLFDDGPQAGDLVAIGEATHDADPIGRFRLARAVKIISALSGSTRLDFDPTGEVVTFRADGQTRPEK